MKPDWGMGLDVPDLTFYFASSLEADPRPGA